MHQQENNSVFGRKRYLVLEYTNLVERFGVDSSEAQKFRREYFSDKVFIERANILDELIRERQSLNSDEGFSRHFAE